MSTNSRNSLSRYPFTVILILLTLSLGMGQEPEVPPPFPPNLPFDPPEVVGVRGELLFEGDEAEPGCLVHELSVPGQGLHVSGSGLYRGMTFNPPAYPVQPADVVSTSTSTGDLLANLASMAQEPVAILVADEFSGFFTVHPDVYQLQQGDEPMLESFQQTGQLSHGSVVLNHINALILGTDMYSITSADPGSGFFDWVGINGAQLIVKAVDLATGGQIDTNTIASRIAEAVGELYQDFQITRMVVNMSWVLLPCSVLEDFLAALPDDFQSYIYALEMANPDQSAIPNLRDELTRLVTWVGGNNPLFQIIHQGDAELWERAELPPETEIAVAFVASSGNFDLNYPMFPAAWDFVVGVSAPEGPPEFSNVGEVIERGAWFILTDPEGFNSIGGTGNVSYAGTSFSAPAVSLFTALDLAQQQPRCTDVAGTSTPVITSPPGLTINQPVDAPLDTAEPLCPY